MNPVAVKYGAPALPQVNLIPPDINDKRAMRAVQTASGLAIVAALVVVGLLAASAFAAKSLAKNDLDQALSRQDQAVAARDAKVAVYQGYVAQENQELTLYQVGWSDMDYSGLLASILAQDNDQTSFEQLEVFPPSASGPGGGTLDPLFGGGIGTVTFTAYAQSYDDALALIDRLESIPGIAKIYAQTQSYVSESPIVVWQVQGSGIITPLVLTHRLYPEGGIVSSDLIDSAVTQMQQGGDSAAATTAPAAGATTAPSASATAGSEG